MLNYYRFVHVAVLLLSVSASKEVLVSESPAVINIYNGCDGSIMENNTNEACTSCPQDQLKTIQETINQNFERQQTEIETLKTENQQLTSTVESLSDRLTNTSCATTNLSDSSEPQSIGFTAYSSAHRNYAQNERVIFDSIISNIGNAYDARSSVFTCPITGVYVISLNILSQNGRLARARIFREDKALVGAFADAVSGMYSSGSGSVVTECTAGERIWVEATRPSNFYGWASTDGRWTIFSGFLLNTY